LIFDNDARWFVVQADGGFYFVYILPAGPSRTKGFKLDISIFDLDFDGIIDKKFDKGYGFIRSKGFQKSLFFHFTALQNADWEDIQIGDNVIIDEIVEEPKGCIAKKVTLKK